MQTPAKKMNRKSSPNKSLVNVKPWTEGISYQYVLQLDKEQWQSLHDESVRNEGSNHSTISFLGKTQNGKSTLIRDILKSLHDSDEIEEVKMPNIMAQLQMNPTSAGVTSYRHVHANGDTLYLNDFEGENGGLPLDDLDKEKTLEKIAARQILTKTDLRRLAYVTSNVIVYITASPIADISASFGDIEDFAREALAAVGNADRPSLLIVFNKQDIGTTDEEDYDQMCLEEDIYKRCDPETFTKEFLAEKDPEGHLHNYFHEVSVVVIPRMGMIVYVIRQDDEVIQINTSVLKTQQTVVTIRELRRLSDHKIIDRQKKGNLCNECVWLALLKLTLRSFYCEKTDGSRDLVVKPLSMASILLEQMVAEGGISSANYFFNKLREFDELMKHKFLIQSTSSKYYCRQRESIVDSVGEGMLGNLAAYHHFISEPHQFSLERFKIEMQLSLFFLVLSSLQKANNFCRDGVVRNDVFLQKLDRIWNDHILADVKKAIPQWINFYAPCMSCCTPKDSMCSPVQCEQTMFNHTGNHLSESRLLITKRTGVLNSLSRGFRRFIRGQTKKEILASSTFDINDAVWDGGMQTSSFQMFLGETKAFYDEVVEVLKSPSHCELSEQVLRAYKALVIAEAYHSSYKLRLTKRLINNDSEFCFICGETFVENFCDLVQSSCGHSFCSACHIFLRDESSQYCDDRHSISRITIGGDLTFGQLAEACPFCFHKLCIPIDWDHSIWETERNFICEDGLQAGSGSTRSEDDCGASYYFASMMQKRNTAKETPTTTPATSTSGTETPTTTPLTSTSGTEKPTTTPPTSTSGKEIPSKSPLASTSGTETPTTKALAATSVKKLATRKPSSRAELSRYLETLADEDIDSSNKLAYCHPYSSLKAPGPFPPDVRDHRELYLSDEEFFSIFEMTKKKFELLAVFQQLALKKKASL